MLLAVSTAPGSVDAMCASDMAKATARRQLSGSDGPTTVKHQCAPIYTAALPQGLASGCMYPQAPGELTLRGLSPQPRPYHPIPASPIASAPGLRPRPGLGLRQSHFNPAVLPPSTLRLIRGSRLTLAIAFGDQALVRQSKMLLQVALHTLRPPLR
jgi:hypothetical protein